MSRAFKWVLAIAVTMVTLVGIAVGATVNTVYRAGMVSVSVAQQDGSEINVALPAGLANAALAAVELVPERHWDVDRDTREMLRSLEKFWPAAQDALDELSAQPDFVLFELTSDREQIVIQKVGRELHVFTDDGSETIRVSLPLSTVKAFTKRLNRIANRLDR